MHKPAMCERRAIPFWLCARSLLLLLLTSESSTSFSSLRSSNGGQFGRRAEILHFDHLIRRLIRHRHPRVEEAAERRRKEESRTKDEDERSSEDEHVLPGPKESARGAACGAFVPQHARDHELCDHDDHDAGVLVELSRRVRIEVRFGVERHRPQQDRHLGPEVREEVTMIARTDAIRDEWT